MISHVTIGASDLERVKAFYGPLMSTLGLVPKFSDMR